MSDAAPSRFPQRWLVLALVALAVAAVAFALGRFSTFGSASAALPPAQNSADAGFARDMQVHHEQAVQMAMEIHRKTDDPEVRVLAHDITTAQAGQRGEMFGWLVEWGLPQAGGPLMAWMQESPEHAHGSAGSELSEEELRAEMGMATPEELDTLAVATGAEADCLFLELMIRHHEGAVPMAQAVIDLGSAPRVRQVAEGMIVAQSSEIEAMQSMQKRKGCSG